MKRNKQKTSKCQFAIKKKKKKDLVIVKNKLMQPPTHYTYKKK